MVRVLGCVEVSIELTDSLKILLQETANQLKGAARRRFQAQSVRENHKNKYPAVY